jgi:hypothetical protein
MLWKRSLRSIGCVLSLACAALIAPVQDAKAAVISLDTWYEFGFDGPGTSMRSGLGTTLATNPPDGDPIVQVVDGPWTITTTGPTVLIVLDLFESVDQFEIFDNLILLGQTSIPTDGGTCGSDITCSLGDARYSRAEFLLAAGNHSFTGAQLAGIPGAGVFHLTEVTSVPEPGSLALVLLGVLALAGVVKRRA